MRPDETSICACISEPYVVNLAGELFQSGVISDAGYQAAIAGDSMLSPAHKVAHLVFEVGESPNSYKFIFRPIKAQTSKPHTTAQTLPGRPGKPHATQVTHNSLVLSWGKPQYSGADSVQSYTITYRAKDDPPGRSHTQTASQLEHTELTNLAAKTTYLFKVRADSATGKIAPKVLMPRENSASCIVAVMQTEAKHV